jgi:hypothetical protein
MKNARGNKDKKLLELRSNAAAMDALGYTVPLSTSFLYLCLSLRVCLDGILKSGFWIKIISDVF